VATQPSPPTLELVNEVPLLPARAPHAHKGDFGRVLVVAGSRGMSGAAILCGSAALRAGAGLVRVATPRELVPIVAAANPCYMTAPLPQDDEGRIDVQAQVDLLDLAQSSDVVALGPGIGQSKAITTLVTEAIAGVDRPMVLDADGLNAIQHDVACLSRRTAPTVLTPHPAEFARLLQTTSDAVQAAREEMAVRLASQHRVIVVLKGHDAVVTDGRRVYVNSTGNPGMATGGTGDVLTGIIASLLGQNSSLSPPRNSASISTASREIWRVTTKARSA
jgi:NAD(P)H-hydrate epimerase